MDSDPADSATVDTCVADACTDFETDDSTLPDSDTCEGGNCLKTDSDSLETTDTETDSDTCKDKECSNSTDDTSGSDTETNETEDTEMETCSLSDCGPVSVSSNGQVVENRRITASGTPGITVNGYTDVIIRNVEIQHNKSKGISFSGAHRLKIENVSIINTGAPEEGPNSDDGQLNIYGTNSDDIRIENARLEKGSSGVYLVQCDAPHLSFIEGYDFRGPFPRGQLVQFNKSPDCILEDFSAINPPDTSWPEDNISVYDSDNCIVRRGFLDGNNAPTGVGIMVEFDNYGESGLVQDVDAIRMGNGCFFGYPAYNVTFERTRCKENICEDQGRGEPSSNGQVWVAGEDASIAVIDSTYFDICSGVHWHSPDADFTTLDIQEADFTVKEAISLNFCWE